MAEQNPYANYGGSVATENPAAPAPTAATNPYAAYGGSVQAPAQPSGTVINNRADELAAKGLSAAGLPTSIADIPNWFQHFIGVAKDSRPAWDTFKNAVENPTQENIVGAVPIIGPASVAMSKDVQKHDYLGAAATLAGTLAVPKVVETGGAVAKAGLRTISNVAETVANTPKAISESQIVEALRKRPDTPAPQHGTPVRVESPLDNPTISKQAGGKDLSAEAIETLKSHVGDKIPIGSTAKTRLMEAVQPVVKTINETAEKMNQVVSKSAQFNTSVATDAGFSENTLTSDIEQIKKDLPPSVQKGLSKDVDAVMRDADTALNSTDPQHVLEQRRLLGNKIDWENVVKNPTTPAEAQNLARVKVYRSLGDKLHSEIPETVELDKKMQPNLELRSHLQNRLGERVISDPHAATVEAQSEFKKGQTVIENADHNLQREKYWKAIKIGLMTGGAGFGLKELRELLGL